MPPALARAIEQPSEEDLPPYLAFGTLDLGSIRCDGERLIARYEYADGSTAYRVDWQPGRCPLEAQFNGEPVTVSGERDLQGAFFQSFLSRAEPAEDPRFIDLCQRVINTGNIHFHFPGAFLRGRPGMLYYPTGLLFGPRVPIVWGNHVPWDVFRILRMPREELPMKLFTEGPRAIISVMPDGELSIEEIEIAQFITPLCQVMDACRYLAQHRLIAPGQTYRVTVDDASVMAPGRLQVYQGHVQGGPALFAVCSSDPTADRPWKDQLVTAVDQIAGCAKDLVREGA
jgi:hypothetical protein